MLRFVVGMKSGWSAPQPVGLYRHQTHVIKTWLPGYTVHSARSIDKGAWQICKNVLIHDGPDDLKKEAYATLGCIEIFNGPKW